MPATVGLSLTKHTSLKQGDEIWADPDGSVTIAFADNGTYTMRGSIQIKSPRSLLRGCRTRRFASENG